MCNQKIANVFEKLLHIGKGPVIIYRLGGRGRVGGFWGGGGHLIFRRTKVASVVTENPKEGSPKT